MTKICEQVKEHFSNISICSYSPGYLFNDFYSTIIHLWPNWYPLVVLVAKAIITEVAHLIQSFADGAAIEPLVWSFEGYAYSAHADT